MNTLGNQDVVRVATWVFGEGWHQNRELVFSEPSRVMDPFSLEKYGSPFDNPLMPQSFNEDYRILQSNRGAIPVGAIENFYSIGVTPRTFKWQDFKTYLASAHQEHMEDIKDGAIPEIQILSEQRGDREYWKTYLKWSLAGSYISMVDFVGTAIFRIVFLVFRAIDSVWYALKSVQCLLKFCVVGLFALAKCLRLTHAPASPVGTGAQVAEELKHHVFKGVVSVWNLLVTVTLPVTMVLRLIVAGLMVMR